MVHPSLQTLPFQEALVLFTTLGLVLSVTQSGVGLAAFRWNGELKGRNELTWFPFVSFVLKKAFRGERHGSQEAQKQVRRVP
jgi:hypothetical protein